MIWFGTVPTWVRVVAGVAISIAVTHLVEEFVSQRLDKRKHSETDDLGANSDRQKNNVIKNAFWH